MKNLTWQNPEQLFVAQELINKVKSKCCGIKVYDDIKTTTACGTLSYLIIMKNCLQGIFCIEDKEIVLEPKINEEYYLYTDTIGENAIGFSTKQLSLF